MSEEIYSLYPSEVELFVAVGHMLDLDEDHQRFHSWRVATIAYHLAERISRFDAPLVFIAGLLSDCGGISFKRHIVDELVDFPAIIEQKSYIDLFFHPITAYESLRRIPGMRRVAQLVLGHHECFNGSGYPVGLKGDDIDLSSQILRLADQVDIAIRLDQPASVEDLMHSLAPVVDEDFSSKLLKILESLLEDELPITKLIIPEKISGEVEKIVLKLQNLKLFNDDDDWERAIEAIGHMIDNRNDRYMHGHSSRVAGLAEKIATELHLDHAEIRAARWTAYLQNMGEVFLRRKLLGKSNKLSEKEFQQIKMHTMHGYKMLEGVKGMSDVALAVRHHHENWDGSGYPDGLRGASIPLASRINRVSDAFDAMVSDRPYQKKREYKNALKELKRQSGKQFDLDIVEVAISILS